MTANRMRDFALYIAISLLVGLSIMWLASHTDRSSAGKIFKWLGLAANTLIVFGYTIKFNRVLWKRRSFWVTVFLLHFFICSRSSSCCDWSMDLGPFGGL